MILIGGCSQPLPTPYEKTIIQEGGKCRMIITHHRCDSCLNAYLEGEHKIIRLTYKDNKNALKHIDLCDECLEKIACHKSGESASLFFIKHNP